METLRKESLQLRIVIVVGVVVTFVLVVFALLPYPAPSKLLDYSTARGVDEEVYTEDINVDECDIEFLDDKSVVKCGSLKIDVNESEAEKPGRVLFINGFEDRASGEYERVSLSVVVRGADAYYEIEGIKM